MYLFFLILTNSGEKGVYTGSTGLQAAYLSGVQGLTHTSTNFTAEDVQALQLPLVSDSKFKGVDILLTSQWPKGVEKYGSTVVGSHCSQHRLIRPLVI